MTSDSPAVPVRLRGVSKRYGSTTAVSELDHQASRWFQEGTRASRQAAKKRQPIRSTIQRLARLVISHLCLQ